MREIKFRAWHKPTKTMQVVRKVDFELSQARAGVFIGNFAWGDGTDAFELMQYTGLKDKNGKEIYEGDIVKWILLERFDNERTEKISEVKFSEEWAGFTPMAMDTDVEDGYYNYRVTEVEVIGNIYENPELLKK